MQQGWLSICRGIMLGSYVLLSINFAEAQYGGSIGDVFRKLNKPNPSKVCPILAEWVQPLFREYPNIDLTQIQENQLNRLEIPLFADDLFIPVFKKSYSSLSPRELSEIRSTQINICAAGKNHEKIPGVEYGFFENSGPLAPSRLPAALTALATARAQLRTANATIAALADTEQGFDQVQGTRTSVAGALDLVWPSERTAFLQVVSAGLQQRAPAALNAKAEALLRLPASLETVQKLQSAPKSEAELFKLVPPAVAQAVTSRLSTRLAQVADTLLGQQREQMHWGATMATMSRITTALARATARWGPSPTAANNAGFGC